MGFIYSTEDMIENGWSLKCRECGSEKISKHIKTCETCGLEGLEWYHKERGIWFKSKGE